VVGVVRSDVPRSDIGRQELVAFSRLTCNERIILRNGRHSSLSNLLSLMYRLPTINLNRSPAPRWRTTKLSRDERLLNRTSLKELSLQDRRNEGRAIIMLFLATIVSVRTMERRVEVV